MRATLCRSKRWSSHRLVRVFLEAVLRQAFVEVVEVDDVDRLVLPRAGEHRLVRSPVAGSICHCKHCEHTPFNMHCMTLCAEPMATGFLLRNFPSGPRRASRTCRTNPAPPITSKRSTS